MPQTFSDHLPANGAASDEELRLIRQFEHELDGYRAQVIDFVNHDPADILATLSGIAGRLSEMRAQLFRRNTHRCTNLRTREVDPLREDLELQFKVWSRRIAVMEFDLRLAGGGT